MISLMSVQDLLLPALWGVGAQPGYVLEVNMLRDDEADRLVVKGHCATTKRDHSFAITRPEIESGSYKSEFRHKVSDLVDFLKYGPVAQGAVQ